jgi:hypothetical protein
MTVADPISENLYLWKRKMVDNAHNKNSLLHTPRTPPSETCTFSFDTATRISFLAVIGLLADMIVLATSSPRLSLYF